MAEVAWFEVPYITKIFGPDQLPMTSRTPAIFRYVADIRKENGDCRCVEIAGDKCIAKVRATKEWIDKLSTEFRLISITEINTLKTQQLHRYKPKYNLATNSVVFDDKPIYLDINVLDKLAIE